ncbi:DUF3616 domain-containing protein [Phormidium sp. CCY1219]|jgi:hypothetical protein|uniref:DUF3616 domain-containing protein n=1 Tax=Phormidium sp. CCY1219 TaxID=2886104 RepID=UPI002D1E8C30|nr:DUF3616 domain-containing protein [Phormidium sp. CCY1219]MEB3831556.1 DUF3616 domain-containing protein [Phormidium sp. CCY1219]
MPEHFLLSRVLLQFDSEKEDLLEELSAVALTPDGSLWVGSDEFLTIERLSPVAPYIYANHTKFKLKNYINLFNEDDEIDIEGMDYSNGYLWVTGSHSTKRKKPKSKKSTEKNLDRLATIKSDYNRYLLARVPIIDGEPFQSYTEDDSSEGKVTAAYLQQTDNNNILIESLKKDEHLGIFVSNFIPSKENGLDIEGIAVEGNKVFLGLRGPVLRGWAVILEIEVEESEPGVLTLKEIGEDGQPYKKYFLDLDGLGIRELCLDGEDMIIMGGATMDLDAAMSVFRLKDVFDLDEDTVVEQDSGDLEVLFHLPFTLQTDMAEGLTLFPCLGQPNSLLVVYDSPDKARFIDDTSLFVDVFKLKR